MPSLTPARVRTPAAVVAVLACLLAALVAAAQPARAAGTPIVAGTPTPVTIENGTDVASFTFTAPAGRSILVHATDSTFSFGAVVSVLDAGGGYVGGDAVGSYWGETHDIGETGAGGPGYTLTVRSFSQDAGSITIRLEFLDHVAGGAIEPGVTRSLALDTPSQVVDLTFQGSAGQRPAVVVPAVQISGGATRQAVSLSLVRPDGSTFDRFTGYVVAPTYAESEVPLDATGTWTLRVDPLDDVSGSIDLSLWFARERSGTLSLGVPATVELDPAESARFTFTAAAGSRLTVEPLESTLHSEVSPGVTPRFTLLGPDGQNPALYPAYPSGFAETQVPLDAGGTWTLVLDPDFDASGSLRFVVRQPQDLTITPSTTGTTDVAIGVKGQRAVLPFTASAGQRLTLEQVAGSWRRPGDGEEPSGQVHFHLEQPGGESIFLGSASSGYVEGPPLPASGTWNLVVDPQDDATGSGTYRLRFATETTRPITLGKATTVTLSPGDTAVYTFAGVAGRRPNVTVESWGWSSESSAAVGLRLLRPDGSELGGRDAPLPRDGRPGFAELPPLDAGGTWKLVVDPEGGVSGSQRFVLRLPADVTQTVTTGRSQTLRLATPGQNAVLSYRPAVGQRPVVRVSAERWTSPSGAPTEVTVTFRGPEGSAAEQRSVRLGGGEGAIRWFEGPVADVAGTWTVTVDPIADTTGQVTYTPRLVRDVTGTLTPNTAAKTATLGTPGQNARYTFAGRAGQRVGVDLTRSSWTAGLADAAVDVRLLGPGGQPAGPAVRVTAAQGPVWVQPDVRDWGSQPLADGTWTLVLDPVDDTVGSATFTTYVRGDLAVPVTPGTPARVTIAAKGRDAVLTVPVTGGGSRLQYTVSGSTFAGAQFGPDDVVLRGEAATLPPGDSSGDFYVWDAGELRLRLHPVAGDTGSLTITLAEVPF